MFKPLSGLALVLITAPLSAQNLLYTLSEEQDASLGSSLNEAGDVNNDGFPDYPYNFAPYTVVPFTNWPDAMVGGGQWPVGPGAPLGISLAEGNPIGNPGTGDTRWLRDLEPLRSDVNGNGIHDSFRYWRHLSNIATANNGYRIIHDISNVLGACPMPRKRSCTR